ncbi:MAG: hypothetical protein D6685_19565 [Bacteroidetes bacterium]|nr:hypothetical protein AWN76_002380 [Rhodothermaceae bacterium RA]RMH49155.1 MAG: hypothetical protein D6685_19565 [Bacteroidota bacterium]
MLKETLRAMETGALAEIGLLAFFFAFVLILIRVFLMTRQECEAARHMPLDDDPEYPVHLDARNHRSL